ncbi:6,7-dimethyl-8-ribityllumazine synthase [Haematococcus lacustris]
MLRGTASCSCPQHSATQVPLISAASHRSTRRGARQSFSSNAYSVSVPSFVKNSPVRPSAIATKATQYVGSVVSDPACKYAVVVARFNDLVTKQLLDGALSSFKRHGVQEEHVEVAWVPGSFELPLVAKSMAMSGKYHAVVAIGAVIQGATTHYDAVVSAATSGILNASLASGVPIVFGVLTTDSLEQALDRAGGKVGNKGGEAAETAVEMASLMLQLQEAGCAALPAAMQSSD